MSEVELCEIVKKTNMFPGFTLHEEVGMDMNGNSCDMVYNKNDKNYYRLKDEIDWNGEKKYSRIVYRTWWMVAVNLFLKILQPFTHDPFLVEVESEMDDDGNPHFIRYCFGKAHFDDKYFERIKSSLQSGRYVERYYK